jgi:DNA-binding transcriptional regulator YhcF (GntR family)
MLDIPVILEEQARASSNAIRLVARILLDHAGNSTTEQRRLSQRDIAVLTGANWQTVHMSLKSLQDEGAIRIERHRMILNKVLLQKVAEAA